MKIERAPYQAWNRLFLISILVFILIVLLQKGYGQLGPGRVFLLNRSVNSFESSSGSDRKINNWLDLGYKYNYWRAGIRVEFHDPRNSLLYNDKITQRYIEFKKDWLRVRAGNSYERLGRGLVFHAFEIQSQTLDRTNQNVAIDRNIDGANINISLDKLEVTGIWGRPLRMFSSERGDPLGGGEIRFRPLPALLLGGTYLRLQTEDFRQNDFHVDMRSAEISLNLDAIDLYAELAQKRSSNTFSDPNGKAVYAAANYAGNTFGLSAEFKRYEDFSTVFNNPPALVKTHSFVLLNRHTHSLNANDEIDYQFEGYFSPNFNTMITLHASGADNLESDERRRFREYFIDSRNEWGDRLISRVLFDYSKDRPVGDLNRWTLATEVDHLLNDRDSILLDGQMQHIDNENSGKYWNMLGLLAFSRSPWITISTQYEHTTNVFADKSNWFSGILNLKIGQHHDVIFTLGSRPAGLVCSGGICFQVPEFEGLELRWNARF